jgi:coenzyme PQQ synthesis protein D (PqqD)
MDLREENCSVKPNQNVIFRRLGDEIVLFHLESDRFYELNGTAARLWELLNAGHDLSQARQQILEEFAVDPIQLASEAENLLNLLRREDLVTFNE